MGCLSTIWCPPSSNILLVILYAYIQTQLYMDSIILCKCYEHLVYLNECCCLSLFHGGTPCVANILAYVAISLPIFEFEIHVIDAILMN